MSENEKITAEDTPKSGVGGITWNKRNKKWMVYCGNKYIGLFKALDDAVAAKKDYEVTHPKKRCKVCGKLIPRAWNQQNDFCSDECKKIWKSQYLKDRFEATRPGQRFCVICGKPIPIDKNAHTIICSDECKKVRQHQYYERSRNVPPSKKRKSPDAGDPIITFSFALPVTMRDWLQKTASKNDETVSKYLRSLIQREIDKKEGTE